MPAIKGNNIDFLEYCLGVVFMAIAEEMELPDDPQGERIEAVLSDMVSKNIDKRLAQMWRSSPELRINLKRGLEELLGDSDEILRYSIVPKFITQFDNRKAQPETAKSMRRIFRNIE